MRTPFRISFFLIFTLAASLRAADPVSYAQLQAGFHDPPHSAKPLTFWMWMNGNITKEGITADLEAFAKVGLGGTQQFIIGGSEAVLDDPSVPFMSPRWRELERFAIQESARLGLDFGTHNAPGWSSSGGPWVTPAESMQKVVFAQTTFQGPGHLNAQLPVGPAIQNYYGDIAVLAFQTAPYTGPRISNALPPGTSGVFPIGLDRGTPLAIVSQPSILDLTRKMAPDGTLAWDAPEGNWTIVRFGHTTTGKTNAAAPTAATGLEVDKLNRAALAAYYAGYPAKLLADAGSLAGTTFNRFEIDSYEAGAQDWTGSMREEFQKRRGYDMLPYLVYLTRRNIVDQAGNDLSTRFQSDYNQTISELFIENYYSALQELIHKTPGMQFMIEPYNTSQICPFDTNNLAGSADIIAAEFWQRPSQWGWSSVKPTTSAAHTWGKNLIAAESFTGQPNYAFQSDPYLLKATGDRAYALGVNKLIYHTSALQPWLNVAPGMTMGWWGTQFGRTITWWEHGAKEWIAYQSRCQFLLQQGHFAGDLCFLQYDRRDPAIPPGYDGDNIGTDVIFNRLSVHDGRLTLPDGLSYAALILPDRTTMTPQLVKRLRDLVNDGATIIGPKPTASSSLEDYPRCDEEVCKIADDLWGAASDADASGLLATSGRPLGKGRVFSGITPEAVLAQLHVAPDLVLTSPATPSPLVWIHRTIGDLDAYFISNQSDLPVWPDASFRIAGKIPELWHAESDTMESAPRWQLQGGRVHIPLILPASGSVFVVFRPPPSGSKPIDPIVSITRDGRPDDSALLRSASADQPSPLSLVVDQSGDYALSTAGGKTFRVTVAPLPAPVDLSSNWQVKFPPKLGAPRQIVLDKLMNLAEHPDAGVKYFSGTATYAKEFDLPTAMFAKDQLLTLDLGTVKNIAEVRINDQAFPLLWLPPFRQEVTAALKPGRNRIEIQVTNLWVNRLVGDERLPDDLAWGDLRSMNINRVNLPIGRDLLTVPDWIHNPATRPSPDRITFSTFKFFTKSSPLLPSGLIGPVTISASQQVDLQPGSGEHP